MILTTEMARHYLADIAWWIKGYIAANENGGVDGFCPGHVEAVRMAIEALGKNPDDAKRAGS